MDIALYKEFSMVAKHRSLTDAAKELKITQPALSRHLAMLEEEAGCELFDRSTSPMDLTPVGELYLEHASAIGNEYERMQDFIRSVRRRSYRTVTVGGLLDEEVSSRLRRAVRALRALEHPVALRFIKGFSATSFDALRSGELGVALEPHSELVDTAGLTSHPFVREEPVVVLERTNPLAMRDAFGLDDLHAMEFVSLRSNREHAIRKHLQALCRRIGLEGSIPRRLTLHPAETYDELFLAGIDGRFVMLPASLATKYVKDDNPDYAVRPFVGEDVAYDVRMYVLATQGAPEVRTAVDEMRKVAQEGSAAG